MLLLLSARGVCATPRRAHHACVKGAHALRCGRGMAGARARTQGWDGTMQAEHDAEIRQYRALAGLNCGPRSDSRPFPPPFKPEATHLPILLQDFYVPRNAARSSGIRARSSAPPPSNRPCVSARAAPPYPALKEARVPARARGRGARGLPKSRKEACAWQTPPPRQQNKAA